MSELWQSPIVVPALAYPDLPAMVSWLERAFGFRERPGSRLTGENWMLTWMDIDGGGLIHLNTGGHGLDCPADSGFASQSLKVYVADVDAHFAMARDAGAEIVMPPGDMFWGGRVYRAKDPGQHLWEFSQAGQELAVEHWRLPGNATRS